MRFCIGRREESSRGIKNPFTFTDACPVGLFLPPTTTTTTMVVGFETPAVVVVVVVVWQTRKEGGRRQNPRRKESERTHAISFTRVEQPLKSLVFDHEKEGKRGKKKDIKPHFL